MAAVSFTPLHVGDITLSHRIVMASMSRCRGVDKTMDQNVMENYYEHRATDGGLIVSEAIYIGEEAGGQSNIAGIWTEKQTSDWKRIVDKVHARGGYIYAQLRADGGAAEIEHASIKHFVQLYVNAARNAVHKAGFDGVELHNANGYLPDQFLNASTNNRTDEYGGCAINRSRFTLSVLAAITEAVGEGRSAIRFSPHGTYQNMGMPQPDVKETFSYLTRTIRDAFPKLAYIHFKFPTPACIGASFDKVEDIEEWSQYLRTLWSEKEERAFFASSGVYDREVAEEIISRMGGAIVLRRYIPSPPNVPARVIFLKTLGCI